MHLALPSGWAGSVVVRGLDGGVDELQLSPGAAKSFTLATADNGEREKRTVKGAIGGPEGAFTQQKAAL